VQATKIFKTYPFVLSQVEGRTAIFTLAPPRVTKSLP
jgi:hypothetical protein